jgi:nicotianamine synthase
MLPSPNNNEPSTLVEMSNYTQKQLPETSAQHTITPPSTPTSTTRSASFLFTQISAIYTTLSSLPSLAPGNQIDALLTRLVELCIEPHDSEVVAKLFAMQGMTELCESLRPLCGAAEGELEGYWARRIVREANEVQGICKSTQDNTKLHRVNITTKIRH